MNPRARAVGLALALAAPLRAGDAFGHRPYREAPAASLADAGDYRSSGRTVRLTKDAAAAWKSMVAAAARDGVQLIPISGFRPVSYQRGLFKRATKKYGSPRDAARWVAPPGHSEHHTGLALDLGDGARPDTDVDQRFESTPAHRWLTQHAREHGFELSFPKDNPQGVSHEPWHWRWIGSAEGKRLFHPADRP
ncbi:MAG TPA: D-alanyl-D-alanine carboxypeptidase family protein [Elusimicrobiota bacterium]|nr:D-alanyl-D-alanine carboxypeptidase family protein [Elusimicrobiota bacterium]HMU95782.1 D-alanyl-D-alanine carboxypeptidase family protein [Elusimicrobiota bacterium]HMX43720.1 D-alanyl-D-alanine carboxypeptidase family protein [Elusimicrobiota bacterium]HMZ26303.1 D-alanyl-D-alanine carboxypeptidase family protein [Elusimicrobiota bacterium]HNC73693.1 D-alanyl-D-alanine carboxypeptidase family protein [Elusimicrobiota bacterium]